MAYPKYAKPEALWLKTTMNSPNCVFRIASVRIPRFSALEILSSRTRTGPSCGAGRLNLLLQDAETNKRYEVECLLGRTDVAHLIRTTEYCGTSGGGVTCGAATPP